MLKVKIDVRNSKTKWMGFTKKKYLKYDLNIFLNDNGLLFFEYDSYKLLFL